MPTTPTSTRPESAPDGAESLPGVIEIYAEYEATKPAAKAEGATRADIDAYDVASAKLIEARRYWRQIKQAVQLKAVADWEAANGGPAAPAVAVNTEIEES